MTRLAGGVDGWLAPTAPPERLAMLRIVVMGFATGYLVIRLPAFLALADLPDDRFEPVGVLAWLREPLGAAWPPVVAATVVAGLLATAGLWFRVSGPLFAGLLLVVTTYRSSWGQLLWFEALVVLHALIVALASSADALSVDARRSAGRRSPSSGYGFPVQLAAIVTVLTYVLAGIAKLKIGGLDWVAGETLRNHVAYSAARLDVLGGTPSPLAGPFMRATWVAGPLALVALVIELAAPVALMGGRARTAWVVGAWGMHLAIAGLMLVVFPYPLLLVAFAPLFPLERLLRARRP